MDEWSSILGKTLVGLDGRHKRVLENEWCGLTNGNEWLLCMCEFNEDDRCPDQALKAIPF